MNALTRGLLAGAAGTVALNGATYLDMLVRARPASTAPAATVEAAVRRAGGQIPGQGPEHDNRTEALGALSGMLTGLGVGVAAALAHALGVRPGAVVGPVLTGAAAMAATDGPMAVLDVSDPTSWSASSWASDVVPHLLYGVVVHATLAALEG